MRIDSLNIIQDELRNPAQVFDMIKYVLGGGNFNHCQPLVEIAVFPDGAHYVHNGHHRCVAMFIAGRTELLSSEYYIKSWTYKDYDDIVFFNEDRSWRGYVTPFDIRKEARIADLSHYKQTVQKVFVLHGEEAARLYIKQTRPLYCYPKKHYTVKDLADDYLRNYGPDATQRNVEKRFCIKA